MRKTNFTSHHEPSFLNLRRTNTQGSQVYVRPELIIGTVTNWKIVDIAIAEPTATSYVEGTIINNTPKNSAIVNLYAAKKTFDRKKTFYE